VSAAKRKRALTAEERAEALEEIRRGSSVYKCWRCGCPIRAELDVSCGCQCHDAHRMIHHLPRLRVA
jgi:hypothetical protein